MSLISAGAKPERRVRERRTNLVKAKLRPGERYVVYQYAECIEAGCKVQTSKGLCRRHRGSGK